MVQLRKRALLLASAAAALSLAPGARGATSQQPAPFSLEVDVPASTPAMAGTRLAHLPADRDLLTLRGERARRRFKVDLPRGAAGQANVFQLAYKNTVTLLPEHSSIEVLVNGRSLAVFQPRSTDAVTVMPIPILQGMLSAGANDVEIVATMAHRVDCSVAASYELWTAIDPARTGFVLPNADFNPVRGLGDVASEPLAADGTTHVSVRLPSTFDEGWMSRAGRFVGALVVRAGLVRPSIDLGHAPGDGAGIDVILAVGSDGARALDGYREIGREGGVVIARSVATGRPAVALVAPDQGALDAKLAGFVDDASKTLHDGSEMAPASRRSFADLGLRTESFSGRHYTADLDVSLPADLFAAADQSARLLLDGVYAGNLDVDGGLTFQVNGTAASSLSLVSDRGGTLQHRPVDLPMRYFHPGHNEITIDAALPSLSDRECDASSASTAPRLVLSDTSELEIPRYAHLATSPQLPGAVKRNAAAGQPLPVYLPDGGESTAASALTLLASMAAQGHAVPQPAMRFGAVAEDAPPGIVVASLSGLPEHLFRRVRDELAPGAARPFPVSGAQAAADAGVAEGGWHAVLRHWSDRAAAMLMREGFTYGTRSETGPIALTAHSFMLASVAPGPRSMAAPDLPSFSTDDRQWLIATGADDGVIRSGLDRMTSGERWRDLEGQAVSIDTADGSFSSTQPRHVAYALPDRLDLADVRPVLGGLLSGNLLLSFGALALFMSLLGASAHLLLRRKKGD